MIIDSIVQRPAWPILLLCGKNGMAHWVAQFEQWAGIEYCNIMYLISDNNREGRDAVWLAAGLNNQPIIVVCTYAMFIREFKRQVVPVHWGTVLMDEAHRIKNRQSVAFKLISKLRAKFIHPLTGTAIRKGPQDLWTMLNLADKRIFGSYHKFVNTFCEQIEGYYGKEIVGPKNVEGLTSLLKQYAVYIPDEVADKYLPASQRIQLEYQASNSQAEWYDRIAEETINQLPEGDLLINPSMMTKLLRLRQLMCMPKLIDPSLDDGGGLELIVERLEEDPHAIIFVPFTKAIPFVVDRLTREGYEHIGILQGGMKPSEVGKVCYMFEDNPDSIIICSLLFAESFSLATGRTTYFLGSDYSPDVISQAEDRIRRANSVARRVINYHLHCHSSVDSTVKSIRENYGRIGRATLKGLVKSLMARKEILEFLK
jgi:SNF2 family DNA or RNA helicase